MSLKIKNILLALFIITIFIGCTQKKNTEESVDVKGLKITNPVEFENAVSQWPGVVTVGVFAVQRAHVCLLGGAQGVKTLSF